jgi:hypothetical protein
MREKSEKFKKGKEKGWDEESARGREEKGGERKGNKEKESVIK